MSLKYALTIAGSDPSGGAGIQADLAAFSAVGVRGLSAISALTVQNNAGVREVEAVSARLVRAQLQALIDCGPVHALKTGMLANADLVQAVATFLHEDPGINAPLVVDPVWRPGKGAAALLSDLGLQTSVRELWPIAHVVSPNLPEAEQILQRSINSPAEQLEAARALLRIGECAAVLLKGGHGNSTELMDVLLQAGQEPVWFHAIRLPIATHGTGCAYSALIAAQLAQGRALTFACSSAQQMMQDGLRRAMAQDTPEKRLSPSWIVDRNN